MNTKPTRSCPVCGEGELVYSARRGRTFDYKGFAYAIPSTMKLVECTHCHDIPMTEQEVEAIEGPIAAQHQKRMTDLVDGALQRLEERVPIGELERLLHLSQGYLARVRSKGEPSFALAALLSLLADNPKQLRRLSDLLPSAH